jgi:hypothetical protein
MKIKAYVPDEKPIRGVSYLPQNIYDACVAGDIVMSADAETAFEWLAASWRFEHEERVRLERERSDGDRHTLLAMIDRLTAERDKLRAALEKFAALRNGGWRGEYTAWENAAHEYAREALGR